MAADGLILNTQPVCRFRHRGVSGPNTRSLSGVFLFFNLETLDNGLFLSAGDYPILHCMNELEWERLAFLIDAGEDGTKQFKFFVICHWFASLALLDAASGAGFALCILSHWKGR
jgi:hypothetical protein